jgi:hypothetical protein
MCHEWWIRRQAEQAEEAPRIWDEFERTRPLSEPRASESEPEVTLEEREQEPAAVER